MSAFRLEQLEQAVGRLLQRNAQLEERCLRLLSDQQNWQLERRELLREIETLLEDLRLMREQCS